MMTKHHLHRKIPAMRWLFVGLFPLVGLGVHELVQRSAPPPLVVESLLERSTPFVPWMIWIYASLFPVLALVVLVVGQDVFRRFVQSMVLSAAVAWGTVLLCPITFQRPDPASIENGFYRGVFSLVHKVDPAHICFPSLHVSSTWICWFLLRSRPGNWSRTFLAVGVSISTMLVKQHLLIDVVAGAALAGACIWLTRAGHGSQPSSRHTQASHFPPTIPTLLKRAGERYGERVAWATDGPGERGVAPGATFRETEALVATRRLQLPAGEGPVALLLDNSQEWVISFLAIVGSARPAVLVDAALPPRDISRQLQHAGAQAVITEEDRAGPLREAWPACRDGRAKVLCIEHPDSWPEGGGQLREPAASDLAAIVYTSGPTRKPRGVELTHASLVGSAMRSVARLEVGPGDVMLALVPFAHILGLVTLLLSPLAAGFKVVFLRSPRPTALMKALRHDVTTLIAPPAVFQLLVRRIREHWNGLPAWKRGLSGGLLLLSKGLGRVAPSLGTTLARRTFSRVRAAVGPQLNLLVSGGAKIEDSVACFLRGLGFDLREGYGLTESAGPVCVDRRFNPRPGSLGPSYEGMEIRIHEPDHMGEGEIWIRGDQVMRGYHGDPELTSRVLVDGWLRSGDIGMWAEDDSLEFRGRRKNLIVTSAGKKVYQDDLEAHFSAVPGVATIRAFGVPDGAEQLPALHVVPSRELAADADNLAAFRKSLERANITLPPHQRVRKIIIESSGKPDKTVENKEILPPSAGSP